MRIGIIGAGAMAKALGKGWAACGHEIFVGTRSPAAAEQLTASIGYGARAGGIDAATEFGEVILLALPVSALDEVLRPIAATLAGRTLIDCTNAFTSESGEFLLTEDAVAERIATIAPRAHVVKAFNLCAAEVWISQSRMFEERRLAVPLCGDHPGSLKAVAGLAEDLGLQPIEAGSLRRARYLEAASVLTIGLWFAGQDARTMYPPLSAFEVVA
jgi:predicted dinucleotide-binding enzyme